MPVSSVRDGDTIHALTGHEGFIPRRVTTVNPLHHRPTRGMVTVYGCYLADGYPAGTGIWEWPTDHTASIERETTP